MGALTLLILNKHEHLSLTTRVQLETLVSKALSATSIRLVLLFGVLLFASERTIGTRQLFNLLPTRSRTLRLHTGCHILALHSETAARTVPLTRLVTIFLHSVLYFEQLGGRCCASLSICRPTKFMALGTDVLAKSCGVACCKTRIPNTTTS